MANPAQFRSPGVMTFIVGSDGVVCQKDLGKETGFYTLVNLPWRYGIELA